MSEITPSEEKIEKPQDWRPKALAVGTVLGALLGLGATYLLIQRAEREERQLTFSTNEGIKLALLMLGTLRQVTQLGGEKG